MPERPSIAFRVEPHMLPGLIAAYGKAISELRPMLIDVSNRGRLQTPWAQDDVSIAMTAHYNEQVMDGEYSVYAALRNYEQELVNVHDTLTRMAADYQQAETENATRMNRL